MSLLLRRRAMMQLAEEGVEGGGPFDGKVIVFRSKQGNYTNARYVSTDYGHSYSRVTTPTLTYSSSNDVDSEGGYWGNNTSNHPIWISGANPKNTSPSWEGGAESAEAVAVSLPGKDGYRHYVKLRNSASTTNYSRANQIIRLYASGSAIGNSSGKGWTTASLPSYISNKAVLAGGAYLDGNRQDLSKLIIADGAGQRHGEDGVRTASISLDGGTNWSNIKDVLVDSQSSLPDGQFKDNVWSFDGKKCVVIYNNTIYVSSNGGQTFTQRTGPTSFSTLAEIKGTEKLKTLFLLYTSGSNSAHCLDKSTDFGQTWERMCTLPATNSRFEVSADGKHFICWSITAGTFWWSDSPSQGWTAATGTLPGAQFNHGSTRGSVRMSLDNGYRGEEGGGDEPVSDPATNITTALQTIASQRSVGNVKFLVNGQTVTPTATTISNYFVILVQSSSQIWIATTGTLWKVATNQWDIIMSAPSNTISEVVTDLMSNYGFEDATY